MTIAAVVITKNEEERIRRCLDSVRRWVDEIVVVDDFSTDQTTAIAEKEYGAKVIRNNLNNDFARQRNIGMEAADSPWVLQLDADEVVPEPAAVKIKEAIERPGECVGFKITRRDCVLDQPLERYLGSCAQLRIFKKGQGRNAGTVHEDVTTEGPVGEIEAFILHYNVPSVRSAIEKNNFYTELECQAFLDQNETLDYKFIKSKLIFRTPKLFYKHYIKNKAYKDGPHGLLKAGINTMHSFVFWLKVLEKALKEKKLRY